MTITAKVIADSISPDNCRLTTIEARYPRMVHAEVMTHRRFSRNTSSSRATPVAKLIEDIERDMAYPVYWGQNQPGMQARKELIPEDAQVARHMWGAAGMSAIKWARELASIGAHKQIVNRILEPFSHITAVITATEWQNFFDLRQHADAQPEIKMLADAIWGVRRASTPEPLRVGKWHLPYVDVKDFLLHDNPKLIDVPTAIKCSAARCARVSYLTHDGKTPSIESDLALFDRLATADPMHASPMEHQATPDQRRSAGVSNFTTGWWHEHEHGNFVGFRQHRRMLPGGIV